MAAPLSIAAFVRDESGLVRPFELHVSAPAYNETDDNYFCVVSCPTILSSEKKIFGVSATQAIGLSRRFVVTLLEAGNHVITDADGTVIDLKTLYLPKKRTRRNIDDRAAKKG